MRAHFSTGIETVEPKQHLWRISHRILGNCPEIADGSNFLFVDSNFGTVSDDRCFVSWADLLGRDQAGPHPPPKGYGEHGVLRPKEIGEAH